MALPYQQSPVRITHVLKDGRAIALTFIAQVAAPHDEMLYAVHQWKMVVAWMICLKAMRNRQRPF